MRTVEEIKRAIEQLEPKDFSKFLVWIDRRRQKSNQDRSGFLNSYASEDEGLYDDAIA
jgi:hypothetical protein